MPKCDFISITFLWNESTAKLRSIAQTGAQPEGERGRTSLHFFENRKNCPDFGKKGSDCVRPWVKPSLG